MTRQSKDSEAPVQEFAFDPQSSTVTALWSLRILIRLGGHKKMYCRLGNGIDEDILEAVGLGHLEDRKIDKNACHKNLKQRLNELERHPPLLPNTLSANLELIREALRLTDAGVTMVALVSLMHADHRLGEALKALQHSGYYNSIARVISTVIDFPVDEVRACLGPKSILRTSGILQLRIGVGYRSDMTDYLCLIDELQSALFVEHDSRDSLFGGFFRISPAPKLTREDYAHLKRDYQLALAHLRTTTRHKSSGVNILIHGPPGVGKTEFARALAKEAGLALYEINTESEDGNPAGNQRIRWYQFCQRSLSEKGHCAVLFDEVEDVFSGWHLEANRPGKGFLNRLLEENSVPSFWISNDVDQMDPAHLRRFDIVLEFQAPGRAIRRRLVESHLGPLAVSEDWMNRLADDEQLLPAEIERASRVARCVAPNGSNVERTVERLIDSSRAVTGTKKRSTVRLPLDYELACVNSNTPLIKLVQGMKRKRTGRLCLYGPPGTGKTAFAHYLATDLDRPLLAKRASDILSMWVGGTEKSLAAMFEAAAGDDAVLLLDEADSFLQDRSIAAHSWEVTQVNELLVQMEAFDGLFICSTNLMDALDTAVLRRFDFKVKLDYLRSEQSWTLFERTMQTLGKDAVNGERFRARLSCLRNLTPGDFAVVKRQASILDTPSNALTLIEALESESRMKKESRSQPMGFVTAH